MPTRRTFLLGSACVAASAALPPFARSARADLGNRLAIVVAKTSSLLGLSQYELEKLYLGTALHNPAGERIVPFNQPPKSPDRIAFDASVLGMTPEQNARYWIDRRIRGQAGAPKSIGPADLLQRVISKLNHSIAYVRFSEVRADVRVIAIDGKVPSDPAYGLFASEEVRHQ